MRIVRAWLPVVMLLGFVVAPVMAVLFIPLELQAEIIPKSIVPQPNNSESVVEFYNLCRFGELLQNVINFMIYGLAIPLAALMFAYAGILYFTGGSNPGRITRAYKIFKNVMFGFVIAISGWLVINTIITVVFDKGFFAGGDWFELQCVSKVTNVPGQEGRLIGTSITDLLDSIVPGVETSGGVEGVVSVDPNTSNTVVCPEGAAYNPERGTCIGADGTPTTPLNSTDLTNRSVLANQGISINAPYPKTSLQGMRAKTINKILQIKEECGTSCEVVVTGGTETTGGHICDQNPANHCTGYKIDLRPTIGVETYIKNRLCNGEKSCTTSDGTKYNREGDHWDIFVP